MRTAMGGVRILIGVLVAWASCSLAADGGTSVPKDRRVHVAEIAGAMLPSHELRAAIEGAFARRGWSLVPAGAAVHQAVAQIHRGDGKTILELSLVRARTGRVIARASTSCPEAAMPSAAAELVDRVVALFERAFPWPSRDPARP